MENKSLNGLEKAALLVMQLEEEVTSKILKALDINDVTKISTAMSNLGCISSDVSDAVVEEAYSLLSKQHLIGNVDSTKEILVRIFGEEEAKNIITDIEPNIWKKLAKLDAEKLSLYLLNENPQIIALVLQKLPETNISKILSHLPSELVIEVILSFKNISKMNKNICNSIEDTIDKDFEIIAQQDGIEMIARIFDGMSRDHRTMYMKALDKKDKSFITAIQDKMFTFESLIKIDKKDIQILFRAVDKEVLAIALKGADAPQREVFLDNISSRAANIIKDDMEYQGPIDVEKVEAAQQEIAYVAKQLLNANEIRLSSVRE